MPDATILCPRCGRTEPADSEFCYCGYIFSRLKANLEFVRATPVLADEGPLPCPVCGIATAHLKSFTFTRTMLFLFVYVFFWEQTFVACPSCMRRILRRRLWANIPSAHLIWPALLLIYLPRFAATYEPGHSRGMNDARRKPSVIQRIGRFLDGIGDHPYQYVGLVVGLVLAASQAFQGRVHLFDPSMIFFMVISGLLIWRVAADFRGSGIERN